MSIFDTGKSSGSQTTVPYMTQGQQSMLQGQTDLATGTMLPTYKNFATGATDMYNTTLPGAQQAAQNLASTAGGVQNLAGGFGGGALQTGVQGLQSMFDPGYVQSQIAAVQGPAQLQYQQNLAGQNAGFGGAGQMGSARQALANTQLAQSNAINQAALGANIENQIRNQQLQAGQSLMGGGYQGLGQALNAAQTGVGASQVGMDLLAKYGNLLGMVPGSTYNPNYSGTIATESGTSQSKTGISI